MTGKSFFSPARSICCAAASNPSLPFLIIPDIGGRREDREVGNGDDGRVCDLGAPSGAAVRRGFNGRPCGMGAPSGTAARRGFDGRPCGMGAPSGAAARRGFDGRPCEMRPYLARPYLLRRHNNQLEVGGGYCNWTNYR
jgi:hypothetical protein